MPPLFFNIALLVDGARKSNCSSEKCWHEGLQAEILGKYANDVFIKPNYFTDVQYFNFFSIRII